jgi:Cu+-exporting ATPase
MLGPAAALENASEHPLAQAIISGATERGVKIGAASEFASITGKGISGRVEGNEVAVGNLPLLEDLRINAADLNKKAEQLRAEGQTVMFVAVGNRTAGLLGVTDPIKASTPEAIRMLHAAGIRIRMLTGDSRGTAEVVARRLGIDDVEAEVLPEQKTHAVKRLQRKAIR